MKNIFPLRVVLCLIALVMMGCGTSRYGKGSSLCDSDIVKVGPDTYRADGSCGGNEEARDAGVFCDRMGKEVLVTNMRGYGDSGKNQTIFRCLTKGDSGYRRPDYQPAPNVIIQDQRQR